MVDKICDFLTNKIRKNIPDVSDERAEIINYGIHLMVGEIPKTFVFLAIAAILGIVKEFLIAIIVIFPYRAFSGGFHLKTHLGCILGTSFMYCGIAYISQFQLFNPDFKHILIGCVWIFGMLMCKLYAPADTENVPILRKKDRRIKQILSYITLTITLLVGALVNNEVVSNIIIIGMLVQTITITRFAYQLTNNQYGHEVYFKDNQKTA